jgi:RNA-directed DNA polymerase
LLARVPVFTTVIRRWLKAGVVELGKREETTTGTPQGGIISPLLANIALDGMERLFGSERPSGRTICPSSRKGHNKASAWFGMPTTSSSPLLRGRRSKATSSRD